MRPFTAMACAAAVTAVLVSGMAARDALFLTSLDVTALPAMLIVSAAASIALALGSTRLMRLAAPAVVVPSLFAGSGILFLAEWLLRDGIPSSIAILVYLHTSAAGPVLASGFWRLAGERFDPRTARRDAGWIAASGAAGALLGALGAERIAAVSGTPSVLLALAALHVACAPLVRRLLAVHAVRQASDDTSDAVRHPAALGPALADLPPVRPALAALAATPFLQQLTALVLFGTTSAALVDYVFKAQAVEAFGRGDHLFRFFAIYYAAVSLFTFLLQTRGRFVLERTGIGAAASAPSWTLLAGSLASFAAPSFGTLAATRGAESVLRHSWFRGGYELAASLLPSVEKRAAISLVAVGLDRTGDALGGGLVLLLAALGCRRAPYVLSLAVVSSVLALLAASRLNRRYSHARPVRSVAGAPTAAGDAAPSPLDTSRTLELVVHDIRQRARAQHEGAGHANHTTGQAMRDLLNRHGLGGSRAVDAALGDALAAAAAPDFDAEIRDILSLRSRERERVAAVLSRADGLTASQVPHVMPLLAWDAVASHAAFALRKVAEERIGQIADALVDPNQDVSVRRRLARVLSVGVSPRAADTALLALDDLRFEVRAEAARSLAAIADKNPRIAIDSERIFAIVLREVAVSRPVWDSRRLLDRGGRESPVDAFVRDRAGASLAHVFTLLSLVLPHEPLHIAFRSLQTDDLCLRATALEYLEGVLPPAIRARLWLLLDAGSAPRPERPHHEVVAGLLRSHRSVELSLEAAQLSVSGLKKA